ncbi:MULTISPECIES: aldo/keto reductase [unclassified Rhodococcus (in: high G+C Gram-positive bacteria)]|uniref:aldo/keto reductase n=1 Tax=unclassified Rhodococcus (in: high G+C Gram-positive bacteria) TaxID=192944 RepID=UPI001E4D2BEE|nr:MULTISPECIES: aldo/keto reductase [unclassified Rhodococcus (in: high G+C Gram-positive bacteria)]
MPLTRAQAVEFIDRRRVIPWAPLGGGVLTGKYTAADLAVPGSDAPAGTRRDLARSSGTLTARGLAIADTVVGVARQLDVTPAQMALAWTLRHPSVVSSLIGARTPEQLQQNISALDVTFEEDQLDILYAASAVDLGFPHEFLMRPMVRGVTTGRTTVRPRPIRTWRAEITASEETGRSWDHRRQPV